MNDDQLDEFERQIGRLRESVETLRERVSSLEGANTGSRTGNGVGGPYDRYDRHVLANVDGDVTDAHPRRLMKLYESAGVYDENKQKERTKRLRRVENERKRE